MAARTTLHQQIQAHLASQHLPPLPQWLNTFLLTANPSVPLASLKKTASYRLLASDITTSIVSTNTSVFPANILDANIKERTLKGPIPVQILDVEDISSSRWSQIEAIEAVECGETTKGREIIRIVPGEQTTSDVQVEMGNGPFKVLLQDVRGSQVYGFELATVEGISLGIAIGGKMVLKDVLLARGVLMLTPETAEMLGGKIEALHKTWTERRKTELKEAVGAAGTG